MNGGGSGDKPDGSAGSAPGGDQSRLGVPDGDRSVEGPGVDVPGSPASDEAPPDDAGAGGSAQPGVAGVDQGDATPPGGESPGGDASGERDVQPGADSGLGEPPSGGVAELPRQAPGDIAGLPVRGDLPIAVQPPSNLTIQIGGPLSQDQQSFELARRVADLQERQISLQEQQFNVQARMQQKELDLRGEMQRQELDLRREAQRAEIELRRVALARADENEKATIRRFENADEARRHFAVRGQTFAMWLAGGSAVALIGSGLVLQRSAVIGVVP